MSVEIEAAGETASLGLGTLTGPPYSLLDEPKVLEVLRGKKRHRDAVYRHLLQKQSSQFEEISILPREAIRTLRTNFVESKTVLEQAKTSRDGATTKLLFKLCDGQRVEGCILHYGKVEYENFPVRHSRAKCRCKDASNGHKQGNLSERCCCQVEELKCGEGVVVPLPEVPTEDPTSATARRFRSNPRSTLCVSSQVGCAMGCTFCATGTMKRIRHLTAWEINEQVFLANRLSKISNVVFMGMGEPLDNYQAVVAAVKFMHDQSCFSLAYKKICISTVGVAPQIRALSKDLPKVRLALSLHAGTQEVRSRLLGLAAKRWSLHEVLEATDFFIKTQEEHGIRQPFVFVEYILIKGENDSVSHARQLGEVMKSRKDHVFVNLIPYNPTDVPFAYEAPSAEAVDKFASTLKEEFGLRATVRQTLGQDVDGACGQLVVTVERKIKSADKARARTQMQKKKADDAAIAVEEIIDRGGTSVKWIKAASTSAAAGVAAAIVATALMFVALRRQSGNRP